MGFTTKGCYDEHGEYGDDDESIELVRARTTAEEFIADDFSEEP